MNNYKDWFDALMAEKAERLVRAKLANWRAERDYDARQRREQAKADAAFAPRAYTVEQARFDEWDERCWNRGEEACLTAPIEAVWAWVYADSFTRSFACDPEFRAAGERGRR